MSKIEKISLILRLSLGFSFIYAAVAHYLDPQAWLGFYPEFMHEMASQQWFTNITSLGELLFGLWLISGRFTFFAATLSAIGLFVIVIFNLDQMDILFRDVSLVGASMALAILHAGENQK